MHLRKIKSAIRRISKNALFKLEVRKNGGIIDHGVRIEIRGHFKVGTNNIISSKGIDSISTSKIILSRDATLTIGNNTGMTSVSIFCKERIEIGDYVNIGAGSIIFDSNFHSTDWKIRRDRKQDVALSKNSPVIIENDVFIGSRCIIMKGVHIGARSIISAGSVVCHDIPNDCIAGGNPCIVIKNINSVG